MRITHRYIADNLLNSLQGNLSRLARYQEQMATGKRMLRPSDDPKMLGELMKIKSTLSYNEQYDTNIDDGLSYLEMSDVSMGTLGDILSKALEYTIQAANDTYAPEDRKALAKQIDKMIDQVVDLANSTVGGKYIYAGMKNGSRPFERVNSNDTDPYNDKIIFMGDSNPVMREVAAGVSYRVDAPGVKIDDDDPMGVFGQSIESNNGEYTIFKYDSSNNATGIGIFRVLFDLRDRLENNEASKLQDSIKEIQTATDELLSQRVAVGARYQHFESLKTQMLDQDVKLTQSLDNIEAADIARLSIEYSRQQLAYNASLAVGAGIMQTSLLNFLK
jgi:flagellar hook-associated protein 3 FlgL